MKKKIISNEMIKKDIYSKLKFWKDRTGDDSQARYIVLNEFFRGDFLAHKGEIKILTGSNQAIVKYNGKIIFDSFQTSFKTDEELIKYILRYVDKSKLVLK